jgi:hypothetical protein
MTIGVRWLGVAVALCCHAAGAAAQDPTAPRDSGPQHPAGHFQRKTTAPFKILPFLNVHP